MFARDTELDSLTLLILHYIIIIYNICSTTDRQTGWIQRQNVKRVDSTTERQTVGFNDRTSNGWIQW